MTSNRALVDVIAQALPISNYTARLNRAMAIIESLSAAGLRADDLEAVLRGEAKIVRNKPSRDPTDAWDGGRLG